MDSLRVFVSLAATRFCRRRDATREMVGMSSPKFGRSMTRVRARSRRVILTIQRKGKATAALGHDFPRARAPRAPSLRRGGSRPERGLAEVSLAAWIRRSDAGHARAFQLQSPRPRHARFAFTLRDRSSEPPPPLGFINIPRTGRRGDGATGRRGDASGCMITIMESRYYRYSRRHPRGRRSVPKTAINGERARFNVDSIFSSACPLRVGVGVGVA